MATRPFEILSRRRTISFLAALSLGLAACGGGDAVSSSPTLAVPADADGQGAGEPAQSAGGDATEADEAASDSAGDEAATDSGGDATAPEGEAPADAAPVENLFPDVDVLNIADGSTLNLAQELGGGDKATLLWFFAPH